MKRKGIYFRAANSSDNFQSMYSFQNYIPARPGLVGMVFDELENTNEKMDIKEQIFSSFKTRFSKYL